MRRIRPQALALLLLLGVPAGGCGEVVVGFDSAARADLRLDGAITIVRFGNGDQEVSGTVVNVGDLEAHDVEVTLTTFVLDSFGTLVAFETVPGVPVFDVVHGTRMLFPGEQGTFAVLLPAPRPRIRQVDVDIGARFPPSGFLFFFFSPGVVIITG
jgi:hypothetical protein